MASILTRLALALAGSTASTIIAKATVVMALALGATRLASGTRASVRHVCLASTFGVLLALPVAAVLMPHLAFAIPIDRAGVAAVSPAMGLNQQTVFATAIAEPMSGAKYVTSRWPLVSTPMLLGIGWGVGATLFLFPLGAALWRLRILRRRGVSWVEGAALARGLAIDAGVRRSVDVLLHEDLVAPMTCGFLRPAIVLPVGATRWTESDVQHAVVHELEHVHRADWPVQVAVRAVCALYWFHPLVWIAWRQLCLDSERACDDAVLRRADRASYAEQLVRLARLLVTRDALPMLSMANCSDLSVRVTAVLDSHQARGRAGWRAAVSAIACAVVLLLAVSPLTAVGRVATPDRTDNQAEPAVPPPVAAATPQHLEGLSKDQAERAVVTPQFEVASIKRNTDVSGQQSSRMLAGGRVEVTNMPLRTLIRIAYGVAGAQVVGGPSWIASIGFDLNAKAPSDTVLEGDRGTPSDQVMAMLRSLLQERFQLRVHRELRDAKTYALVLARGNSRLGPQFKASTVDCGVPDACGIRGGNGDVAYAGMTLGQIAASIAGYAAVRAPVSDRTGLTGRYDLHLQYNDDNGPTVFAALVEQAGLRLQPENGRAEFVVVDAAEQPTAN